MLLSVNRMPTHIMPIEIANFRVKTPPFVVPWKDRTQHPSTQINNLQSDGTLDRRLHRNVSRSLELLDVTTKSGGAASHLQWGDSPGMKK
jgi:hypothetical protein